MMRQTARGSVLIKLVLVVLVASGFAGLAVFMDFRFGEVSEEIASLERRLLLGEAERNQLRHDLTRTLDLYELVGSELAAKGEEFSAALGRAVVAKDQEIAHTQDVLEEVRRSVVRLAAAIEEENRRRDEDLSRQEEAVRELRELLGSTREAYAALTSRIDAAGRDLRAEISGLEKVFADYRKSLDERWETRDGQIAALEGRLESELGWMQGELQRARRQLDDLSHAVGRLEALRAE